MGSSKYIKLPVGRLSDLSPDGGGGFIRGGGRFISELLNEKTSEHISAKQYGLSDDYRVGWMADLR